MTDSVGKSQANAGLARACRTCGADISSAHRLARFCKAHAPKKTAPGRSMRSAVNAKCKDCIYDPLSGLGSWRQQTDACTATDCPLFDFRPRSTARSA